MIKAIFCDLDGTLLRGDMTLSRENSEAITELVRRGIAFIPTTGRAYFDMPSEVREHSDIKYHICSNGAATYDMQTKDSYHRSIPSNEMSKIRDILSGMSVFNVIHSTDGNAYFDRSRSDIDIMKSYRLSDYYCDYFKKNSRPMDALEDRISNGEGIDMLVSFFRYEEERERAMTELSLIDVGYTNSAHAQLEIFNKTSGKGQAVLDFIGRCNLSPEEIIAVGDSKNDISMLALTPNSLAVSGAVPELKETAAHIGCSSEEHIAKYILENLI